MQRANRPQISSSNGERIYEKNQTDRQRTKNIETNRHETSGSEDDSDSWLDEGQRELENIPANPEERRDGERRWRDKRAGVAPAIHQASLVEELEHFFKSLSLRDAANSVGRASSAKLGRRPERKVEVLSAARDRRLELGGLSRSEHRSTSQDEAALDGHSRCLAKHESGPARDQADRESSSSLDSSLFIGPKAGDLGGGTKNEPRSNNNLDGGDWGSSFACSRECRECRSSASSVGVAGKHRRDWEGEQVVCQAASGNSLSDYLWEVKHKNQQVSWVFGRGSVELGANFGLDLGQNLLDLSRGSTAARAESGSNFCTHCKTNNGASTSDEHEEGNDDDCSAYSTPELVNAIDRVADSPAESDERTSLSSASEREATESSGAFGLPSAFELGRPERRQQIEWNSLNRATCAPALSPACLSCESERRRRQARASSSEQYRVSLCDSLNLLADEREGPIEFEEIVPRSRSQEPQSGDGETADALLCERRAAPPSSAWKVARASDENEPADYDCGSSLCYSDELRRASTDSLDQGATCPCWSRPPDMIEAKFSARQETAKRKQIHARSSNKGSENTAATRERREKGANLSEPTLHNGEWLELGANLTPRRAQLGPRLLHEATERSPNHKAREIFNSNSEAQVRDQIREAAELSSCTESRCPSGAAAIARGTVDPADPGGADMKAAKELAKISAPSLAALQYLPGQFEVKLSRRFDERSKALTSDDGAPVAEMDVDATEPRADRVRRKGPSQRCANGTDDSCLFLQRLCLCDCMARPCPHHARVQALSREEAPKVSACDDDEHRTHHEPSQQAALKSGLRRARSSLASVGLTLTRQKNSTSSECQRDESLSPAPAERAGTRSSQREAEKQSPSFLTLLSSSTSKPNGKTDEERVDSRPSQAKLQGGDERVTRLELPGKSRQRHSGHSKSRHQHMKNCGALFSPSEESASGPARLVTDCDGGASSERGRDLRGRAGQPSRGAPSIAKNSEARDHNSLLEVIARGRVEGEDCKKRKSIKSTYRKFLSPGKKFFSSGSSVSSSSVCQDHQPTSELDSELENKQRLRSFLSRSLGRFSERRQLKRHQRGKRPRELVERSASGQNCVSPGVCRSSPSPDSTLGLGSVNSLEAASRSCPTSFSSLSATPTRLVQTPEIVLSRVEHLNGDFEDDNDSPSSGANSTEVIMTRSISSTQSAGYRDRRSAGPRHTSDLDLALNRSASSDSSMARSLRSPLSVPGSPRSSRRRRQRSKSPRLTNSPVPFQSPASESTKIEDGLLVCSTELFEKHIDDIKGNQTDAQKRLFTAWINHFVPNLIRHDLIEELRDGVKLIRLLATLTHDKELTLHYDRLQRDRQFYIDKFAITPSSRLKHLQNVSIALDFLRQKLDMKLVNLHAMDIVSGKSTVILGLCWNIILNFQLQDDAGTSNLSEQAATLQRALTEEQMKKARSSYREALSELHEWLATAEAKLSSSLMPIDSESQAEFDYDRLTQHLSRLDDLIEYFELEPIMDHDGSPPSPTGDTSLSSKSAYAQDESSGNRSLSNSLISLSSTSSRFSALKQSKKPSYYKYFDHFDRECCMLATMLERDQREALSLEARDLKLRLKYITERRVPQAVNELRMRINRCQLSIGEEMEEEDGEDGEEEEEVEVDEEEEEETCFGDRQDGTATEAETQIRVAPPRPNDLLTERSEQNDGDNEDDCLLVGDEPPLETVEETLSSQSTKDDLLAATQHQSGPEPTRIDPRDMSKSEICRAKGKRKNLSPHMNKKKNKNKKRRKALATIASQARIEQCASPKTDGSKSDGDDESSIVRALWTRITRASKLTISINIVLLICLAGMCVLPLMQKDACCELSKSRIPPGRFSTVYRKPV